VKKVSLKQGLKALGYEVVQFNNGYNFRSGFMRKDEQLYYFSYEDLRDVTPRLLVRTADENKKDKNGKFIDFTGGINTYPNLERLGLYIVETRKSWDGA
jgi:hypothetical protein